MRRASGWVAVLMLAAGCAAERIDPSPDQATAQTTSLVDVEAEAPLTAGSIAACSGKALGDACDQTSACENSRFGILTCGPRQFPSPAAARTDDNVI